MKEALEKIEEFNNAFGVRYRLTFDEHLPSNTISLREDLMVEEIKAWADAAYGAAPVEDRAKELADILYVVLGTVVAEGLQSVIEEVFNEVHRSNMSKLDKDGKPLKRSDGKILKSKHYTAPDLSFIRNRAKEENEIVGQTEQLEELPAKTKAGEKK